MPESCVTIFIAEILIYIARQMLTASRGEPENARTHAQGINERLWARDSGCSVTWTNVVSHGR